MSTQIFLDHSDFSKSRRAVMVSSVTLFIFTQLELKSNYIRIFELELLVDHKKIVLFALFTVMYFGFIFSVHYIGIKNKVIIDQIEEIKSKSSDLQGAKILSILDEKSFQIIEDLFRVVEGKPTKQTITVPDIENLKIKIQQVNINHFKRKVVVRLLTEILPPMVFFALSLISGVKFFLV